MNAIIITIGDEILSGATVDTNAAYIAKDLLAIGVDVTKRCSVGDNTEDIEREINAGLAAFDLVITTGGLGPTEDDITKGVICRVFETQLIEYEEVLSALKVRYQQLGISMSEMARGMAKQPEGATLLANPLGTAPGILFDREGTVFCAMAGVPSEMRALMDQALIPYLEKRGSHRVILFRNISTFGIPESKLATMLKESGYTPDGVRMAFLPSYAGVTLRLRGDGLDRSEVEKTLEKNFEEICEVVKKHIFSTEEESLLDKVTTLLKEKKVTLSTAESCTGGLIAKMLTDIAGSSDYFVQGAVTYSNEAKMARLGVKSETLQKYGAVSEQTCREMAEGMRRTSETDFALASTGIAGPGGGTAERPVGLVYLAVADHNGATVKRCSFSGDRYVIRTRSAYTVLNLLRLKLLEM
ncbi:MAG: competence/damage-inducible protein A [candidate division Zixibacteria bacterium]|nr:competence/damage-inducible protein A [candidate division Zixibacteria bacterium]